jgi:predicted MPP superfamily phosphohydrolase
VVSNPPYIADHDPDVQPGVKAHEPHVALFGGAAGLDGIKTMAEGIPALLAPGGRWFCEFGEGQSKLAALISGHHFDAVVLTGDIGDDDGGYEPIWELASILTSSSDDVWYLPGNHDSAKVGSGLAERGVPTLPTDSAVAFAQSTDPTGKQIALVYGKSSESIKAADGKGQTLLVIASHTPPSATRLEAGKSLGAGVHLFIAGHTHGGQVRLPLVGAVWAPLSWSKEERAPANGSEVTFLPQLRGRFVDGMYDADGQLVFVSRGLEQTVLGQHRFLCRAEMVEYRFVPE